MTAIYHLADIGNGRNYVRISVDAAGVPTVEAQHTIQADATSFNAQGKLAIFSTDGGQTLWAGGDSYLNNTQCPSLHKSVDGGATWTNEAAKLPYAVAQPGGTKVSSLAGFPGDAELFLGCEVAFNPYHIAKYDEGLDTWAVNTLLPSNRPNSMWVREGTDEIYAVNFNVATWLIRSTDRGATWAADPTYADYVYYNVNFGQNPAHIVVEADGSITTMNFSNGLYCIRGKWGGPWAADPIISPGSTQWADGRMMGIDELGAVWFKSDSHNVHRRDPTTGLWSVSKTLVSGNLGGLWVIDSKNVLVSQAGYFYTWNGTAWTTTLCTDLGLPGAGAATYPAIWADTAGGGGGGGGDLAGGPRFRVGYDPDKNSGPRQEDGSLQSDMQIVTGVQNIATFDGGTLED